MKKQTGILMRVSASALAFSLAATGAAAHSAAVSAQDGDAVQADSNEIVVTASKREEKLRDVPSAITVLHGDTLADLGVRSVRDYATLTPGLTIQGDGTPGSGKVFIRGMQTGALQQSATTVYYVDDVVFTSSSANGGGAFVAPDPELIELDRIEVLKGPQGTLYGASSLGGVIRLISKRPDASRYSVSARAEVTAVDGGGVGYLMNLSVNVPLVTDTLALRATGFYRRAPGFVDNIGTGVNDVNQSFSKGARLALAWTPSDRLTIDLVGMMQDSETEGPALQENVRGTFTPLYGERQYSAFYNAPSSLRYRVASLTARYDTGIGDLIATGSYLESTLNADNDITASGVGTLAQLGLLGLVSIVNESRIPQKKTTAEVRFVSNRLGPVEFIVGGFYTKESVDLATNLTLRSIPDNSLFPGLGLLLAAPITDRYQEVSAFGNLTYYLTDQLDITGGLRFAHYEEDFTLDYGGALYPVSPGIPPRSIKADHWAYLATLRWRPTDRLSFFLRAANSFRPGGPQTAAPPLPPGAPNEVKADTVWNYEAGMKADLFDGKLSVQASAYRIDWKDIQIYSGYEALPGVRLPFLSNAGNARVEGFELAVQARPTGNTTIGGSVGYTDPRITDADPNVTAVSGARRGATIPQTPKWTASATADQAFALGGDTKGQIGATFRYQDGYVTSFPNSTLSPFARVPGYTTVDLRAGVSFGEYNVQLRAENIFDEAGVINYSPGTPGFGAPGDVGYYPDSPAVSNLIRPRSFTLAFSTRF